MSDYHATVATYENKHGETCYKLAISAPGAWKPISITSFEAPAILACIDALRDFATAHPYSPRVKARKETASEKTARLERENASMSKDVAELKAMMAAMLAGNTPKPNGNGSAPAIPRSTGIPAGVSR